MVSLSPLKWFTREAVQVEVEPASIVVEHIHLPSIVLIHGAYQSTLTFEYLRHALPGFQYINIDWSPTGGFYNNLDEMIKAVKGHGPVYIIGHSMGGIYAAHLSQSVECIGGATVSTPWRGSRSADWMRYIIPSYDLYKEIGTKSVIIAKARKLELPGRWTNYVSTGGNVPGMPGENDCVLTIDSMTARKDLHTKFIKATHYEIIMSSDIVHSIGKNYLRASEKSKPPLDI